MRRISAARKSRFNMLVLGLATMAALGFWGGPAAATVIEQAHYSGTDSYSFDDCGFTLDGESTFYGQALLRVDKGGEAFLVKDTYWYRDVPFCEIAAELTGA